MFNKWSIHKKSQNFMKPDALLTISYVGTGISTKFHLTVAIILCELPQ